MNDDRKVWSNGSQEKSVEDFYGSGIDGYHDYHDGYLNFGLWNRPNLTYRQAAENLVRTVGRLLGLDKNSCLLDVGCGMGTQDVFLLREFDPKSIVGLDVTWKHVVRSQKRANREQIDPTRLQFNHGSGTHLPFEDRSFTHVLSLEAPEHMKTREQFFREAYRVLKPGGVLVITDYPLVHKPRHVFEKLVVMLAAWLWHVPKENIYENYVFEEKLHVAGFTNIEIQNIGQDVIPGYYFEHRRPESIAEIRKIRGFWKGVVGGWLIDASVYGAFKAGLCEYNLIRATKL